MKPIIGTVSAALLVAASAAAQAGPLVPSGTDGSPLYQPVSDLDGPYYSEAPPPPPAPGSGAALRLRSGPDYGYRPPAAGVSGAGSLSPRALSAGRLSSGLQLRAGFPAGA